MSNLLITGAAGFIGTNFVHYWHKSNPEDNIVVLDALTYAGCKSNLAQHEDAGWFAFLKGSICDQVLVESLLLEHDIDTLVHFAAESQHPLE